MRQEVVMPKMGESLQEGTIIQWMKQVGDSVERDEMILEISTDKVDTEVPSPVAGTLVEILAQEEETVEVGSVIAIIDTEGGEAGSAPAQTENVKAEEPAPAPKEEEKAAEPAQEEQSSGGDDSGDTIDLVMPKMGESLQEGTIISWLKQVGDDVERDEMILEISTDKVDTEVPSPVKGKLVDILAQEEETVEVGSVIGKISTGSGGGSKPKSAPAAKKEESTSTAPAPKKEESPSAPAPQAQSSQQVQGTTFEIPRQKDGKFYSPLVRAIAEDNKVSLEELETITGSGADGRITKDDLESYLSNRGSAPAQQSAPNQAPATAPAQSSQPSQQAPAPAAQAKPASAPAAMKGDAEIIPMDRMRQLISDHMVMSKQTSAHVTSVGEADITGIVQFRNKEKNAFQQREGFKLTFTPFFLKAINEAIREFPMMNVSVDGKNIIKHNNLNLGFATALPDNNLIVPVIKNADGLSLTGLARSVYDLSTRARSKQLNPDDIQGGTFTMTNVGTFGTLFGTPIINQPQTGIFGVGAIQKRPVARKFEGMDIVVVRDMVYLSITYDHRVIDGMLAGQFLAATIRALEAMNPDTIQF
ncbi:MAG: 2-oxoglutarate dehydrogenase, E2 component, dihydrolipoamide succinyltransferase [Candidatus Kapaibacteriales bacterium]